MRRKHFLVYYDNRVREIIKTIPRTWAKANRAHFPKYTFIGENHPTDEIIEKYLLNYYGFEKEEYEDFVITYNFNQFIKEANGLNFIL